jgi:hypothetical protein
VVDSRKSRRAGDTRLFGRRLSNHQRPVVSHVGTGDIGTSSVPFLSFLACIIITNIITVLVHPVTHTSRFLHHASPNLESQRIHPSGERESPPPCYTQPAAFSVDTVVKEGLEMGVHQPVSVDVWTGGWVE